MKKKLALMLAGAMMLSMPYAVGAEQQTEAVAEAPSGSSLDALTWDSYAVMVDEEFYQVPFYVSELDAEKWSTSDDMSTELSPNSYVLVYYKNKAGKQVMLKVANFGNNTVAAKDGIVVGMEFDNYYWDLAESNIRLPQGIVYGKSTREEIEATYGTPSDVYEGSSYTKITYETDIYESVELQVGLESGVLEGIEIECFREPEGFDAGEVSSETPAEVASYTAPSGLSDDISSPVIRIRDKYYTMPIPVSVLMEDGWTLRESDTADFVAGNGSNWVGLQLEGQYFHTIAKNFAANAVTPENAWVVEMTFGKNELDLDAEFSGGLHIGITEDELTALLDESGLAYERNESGDYVTYVVNVNETKEQRIISFYQGDGDYYDKDGAYSIEIVDRTLGLSEFDAPAQADAEDAENTENTDTADGSTAAALLESVQALLDADADQNRDSIKTILEQVKGLVGDSNVSVTALLDSAITLLEGDTVDVSSVAALITSIKALL